MTSLDAGRVLRPGSAEYDAARQVWNGMVDRRPRLIVRCTAVEDVVAGLEHARAEGLEVGVRCGGHSIVGHAVPEDGLMLDLAALPGWRPSPAART